MKKTLIFKMGTTCIALAGVLFGCAKSSDDSGNTDKTSKYITVKMPSESSGVDTRTGGLDDEIAIKRAYIVVYAGGAVDADMPKFASKIELVDIKDDGVNTKKILAFKPTDNIAEGDELNIIFNKEVASLSVSKKELISSLKLTNATGLVTLSDGLPMHGIGKWTSTGSPIIKVNRAVAKVQLKLDYKGSSHVPGSEGASYTIANTTYKLYQLSDVGNINGTDVEVTTNNPITEITNEEDIKEVSSIFLADGNDDYIGANYIYAYPYSTKPIGTTSTPIDNKASSTKRFAMIMKNIKDGVASYHRLDLYDQNSKTYLDILNNHHYTIKVREMSQQGYDTATKALMGPASNVKFDIIVEEEGTVIISNGQYVLNVNELGLDFTATAPAISVIEIAKVNRASSAIASMDPSTDFGVELQDVTLVSGAATISLSDVPDKLGKDTHSLNISVIGEGVVTFRYIAKLGNIAHTSGLIKVTHTLVPVTAEGFCPSAGRPNGTILKGHDIHELLGITNTAYTITNVTSTFNKDWDAMIAVAPSINNLPTTSKWNATSNGMSVSISTTGTNNKAYFHPFRTSPEEADIDGVLTVAVKTVSENTPFTLTLPLKIVTNCHLPTKEDNYSIQINNFKIADRNVGALLPSGGMNELADKYFTNEIGHPDYIAGSTGGSSSSWTPQIKDIADRAGEFFAYKRYNSNSMKEAAPACADFALGNDNWRLPTGAIDGGTAEINQMLTQTRFSKKRAFFLSTVTTVGSKPSLVKYKGVFFHMSGWSGAPKSVDGSYWSGTAQSTKRAYRISNWPYKANVYYRDMFYGFSVRCVQQV